MFLPVKWKCKFCLGTWAFFRQYCCRRPDQVELGGAGVEKEEKREGERERRGREAHKKVELTPTNGWQIGNFLPSSVLGLNLSQALSVLSSLFISAGAAATAADRRRRRES